MVPWRCEGLGLGQESKVMQEGAHQRSVPRHPPNEELVLNMDENYIGKVETPGASSASRTHSTFAGIGQGAGTNHTCYYRVATPCPKKQAAQIGSVDFCSSLCSLCRCWAAVQ